MTNIILREITKCTEEQKREVRDVRNQESVRKSMYTDHEISFTEHMDWLERLRNDNRQIVFVVLVEGRVGGVVSLNKIDRLHLKSDWAFYLDVNSRGGLGGALEFSLINFAFDELGLKKLNCEVLETNDAIVKMHKKFGFIEEDYTPEKIIKNNARIGVFFLGLTKSDWLQDRISIGKKYEKVINKFKLKIEYETSSI